jgi:lysine 2,3-aminomutase
MAGHDKLGITAMNAAPKILRHLSDLEAAGLAPAEKRAALEQVAAQYAVAITPAMAALIDRADPSDPIARQFVPDPAELVVQSKERADPIGDNAHSPVEGIVHRYPDRVLLKLTHVCAVYCRFCFRREMVGPGAEPLTARQLDAALGYIAAHPEVWEAVLTGGDPLVLSARRLKQVVSRIAAIPHVKIIRLHTRIPVADPARITGEFVHSLKAKGKATYVVLHANHARELTNAAREACARLIDAGIPMLSQSVLLAGVNDDPQTLGELMRALVECRIKPYYLHHGDLAPGTSHLRTSIERGQELMRALRGRLSGVCQPTYVLDIPGGHGKSPIGPNYLSRDEAGHSLIEDFNGGLHCYPPLRSD